MKKNTGYIKAKATIFLIPLLLTLLGAYDLDNNQDEDNSVAQVNTVNSSGRMTDY